MSQMEAVPSGVHLEHVGPYKWKLTGKKLEVYVVREVRKVHEIYKPRGRLVERPTWVVKDSLSDEGIPFGSAGDALSHAYHKVL